ncbi:MAG: NUDIX hydrolase [Bacillaceae bacterium]
MNFKQTILDYLPRNEQEQSDKRVILTYIEQFPETILTRENEFAHMTSSGFIMNPSLTKVLMIHHNIYNTWAWTGGHADGESDLLHVAIKEAMEETGIKYVNPLSKEIASIDILPVPGHIKKGNYISTHLHLNVAYVLIADEEEALMINEEENSGVQWIKAEEIDQYSNEPDLIYVYNKLIDQARKWDTSYENKKTTL